MDLSQYAEQLRRELTAITKFAGDDITRAAEMLAESLDSSVRLALLDVLSAAADEITASIDGAVIDVRLSGTEPQFVVTVTGDEHANGQAEQPLSGEAAEEAGTARVTLRMPESLKSTVEAQAAAEGLSVNTWLVRAVSRALNRQSGRGNRPRPGVGKRYTGFARS
jgi:predicted DNA binding CopG/RHH family protein